MMGECPDVGSDACGAKAGGGPAGPPGWRLARGEEGEVRGLNVGIRSVKTMLYE